MPEDLLSLQIGGATVADNLQRAVAAGTLKRDSTGLLERAARPARSLDWVRVKNGEAMDCDFLMEFVYRHAYAASAVPQGCSACYKVKVVPRSLRELVAAWQIGKRIACNSKWGIDLNNRYSQDIYAGFFYAAGLAEARALYRVVREAFVADPKLGPDIATTIKRGCSEYEATLGPSDRYTFAPGLAELEARLKSGFRDAVQEDRPLGAIMARWIDVAFRIGDDTYLDFTQGRRLRPKMVTYDPAPDTDTFA